MQRMRSCSIEREAEFAIGKVSGYLRMISIGDVFDKKYRIAARLGSGGFGEVFVATDSTVPDRRVAIKILSAGSAVSQDNLIWEMRALAKFNHPGVVTFFHHFSDADRLFLVMEHCSQGSLNDRLRNGPPCSPEDVFSWGLTLCQTLGFVHEQTCEGSAA